MAASGKDDAVDADHFFGVGVAEDDAFAEVVFFESNDFAASEDSNAESIGEVAGEGLAGFWVFAGEEAFVRF